MVGAWAEGLLPKELLVVQPDDRRWWQRLHLFLAEYASRRRVAYLQDELRYMTAGAGAATGETAQTCWQLAGEALNELRQRLTYQQKTRREAPNAQQLTTLWEDTFGKLDDPATQRAIAHTATALQAAARQRKVHVL